MSIHLVPEYSPSFLGTIKYLNLVCQGMISESLADWAYLVGHSKTTLTYDILKMPLDNPN